jgi:rhodanese-related sulfurtransferase
VLKMPIAHVSVTEAHNLQQAGATLVDVRSTAEYAAGHAAGAVNVPLMEHDEDSGQMMPNPDFVRVMRANFPPDTPLLLSCQAGGRSMRACQMLDSFGFSSLTNIRGGFLGKHDPTGHMIEPGWAPSGLPVEDAPQPGASYADLIAKTDPNV